jgi:hypothetical protein
MNRVTKKTISAVMSFAIALTLIAPAGLSAQALSAAKPSADFAYDYVGPYSNGKAFAVKATDFGYIDTTGKYTKIRNGYASEAQAYASYGMNFLQTGDGTYTSINGVTYQYVDTENSIPGFYPVEDNSGKWGYADKDGNLVIDCDYDYTYGFSNGLAGVVITDNGIDHLSFIKEDGTQAFTADYNYKSGFDDQGYAVVQNKVNYLYGLIDKTGNVVLACNYQDIQYANSTGLYAVKGDYSSDPSGLYGLFDLNNPGKTIDFKYNNAFHFSAGLALVKIDYRVNYINKEEDVVVPTTAWEGYDFDAQGVAVVQVTSGNMYHAIDNTGAEIPGTKAFGGYGFEDGCALIAQLENGVLKNHLINENGQILNNDAFDDAYYENGLFFVEKDEKWGIVDTNGKYIVPCDYQNAGDVKDNITGTVYPQVLESDNTFTILDTDGKIMFSGLSCYIPDLNNGIATIGNSSENFGVLNLGELRELLPCQYDGIESRESMLVARKTDNGEDKYDALILDDSGVATPAPDLGATYSADTGMITAAAGEGNHLAYKVLKSQPATPNTLDLIPYATVYKDGDEVTGYTKGDYLAIYELDPAGGVVKYSLVHEGSAPPIGGGTGNTTPPTPPDKTINGGSDSGTGGQGSGGTGAKITPADTNPSTVGNVIVNVGNVTVTAPSSVFSGMLQDSDSWLVLSQQPPAPPTQTQVATAAAASGVTPVTTLDVDLTRYFSNGTSEPVHQLGSSAQVTIKLTAAQIAQISDPSQAQLLYYDPTSGKFSNMNAIFDLAAGTATFTTNHFSTFVITTNGTVGVTYDSHIQNLAWLPYVKDGEQTGTTGKSLRLEAVNVKLTGNVPTGAAITYQTYVQSKGWQTPVSNGVESGTTGKCLRVEALRMTLKGLDGYEVKYRVHIQNLGWQDWKTTENGADITSAALAGTQGKSLRVEAVEIELTKTAK